MKGAEGGWRVRRAVGKCGGSKERPLGICLILIKSSLLPLILRTFIHLSFSQTSVESDEI